VIIDKSAKNIKNYKKKEITIKQLKIFLNLLSNWSQNFPNDFRKKSTWLLFYKIREKCLDLKDPDIMDSFDEIAFYLTSKLKDLNDYEEYLQNINNQLLKKVSDVSITKVLTIHITFKLLF